MAVPDTQAFAALTRFPGHGARERLLNAACQLFYRDGIHAIGIDTIIAEAGVAKMSLYRHFGSKDGLVAAYLEHRNDYWQQLFQTRLLAADMAARDKLLLYFDLIGAWIECGDFHGCAYINADAERVNDSVRAIITQHKAAMRAMLETLAEQAGMSNARAVAAQLHVLAEGAMVTAGLEQSAAPARTARDAARQLIELHNAIR